MQLLLQNNTHSANFKYASPELLPASSLPKVNETISNKTQYLPQHNFFDRSGSFPVLRQVFYKIRTLFFHFQTYQNQILCNSTLIKIFVATLKKLYAFISRFSAESYIYNACLKYLKCTNYLKKKAIVPCILPCLFPMDRH